MIFLDVDGVIVTPRSHRALGKGWLKRAPDPVAIGFLNRIARETGAAMVVSSTWRKDGPSFLRQLRHWGYDGRVHEDWRTDELPGLRGDQIQRWLDKHPEVTRFAILDDDSDMLPTQMPNFVKTHYEDGMSLQHYESLRTILLSASGPAVRPQP